jgi:ribosomal protein L3 glutamine methyltransferase
VSHYRNYYLLLDNRTHRAKENTCWRLWWVFLSGYRSTRLRCSRLAQFVAKADIHESTAPHLPLKPVFHAKLFRARLRQSGVKAVVLKKQGHCIMAKAPAKAAGPEQELHTVRDWLRYTVSRFNHAKLVYGHGTATAFDEAAFLILHALHLPIDQLDPWLEARVLPSERRALADIVERRISTRKPAPYLTNEAWVGGFSFYVDERAIVPRSYIGELMRDGLADAISDPGTVGHILDLCTGSGCLAILAAHAFPDAKVDASDISGAALAVAERNVADYALQHRIALIRSDLLDGLAGRRYDLILANPPYVSDDAVAAFPPEYAAEPVAAHAGGGDGLDIVRRILDRAADHLTPQGTLVVEIGTGRQVLERDYPDVPFLWLDTAESQGEVFALHRGALP